MRPYSAIATRCLLLAVLAGCAHGPPTAAPPASPAPVTPPSPAATPPALTPETAQVPVPAAAPPTPAATGSPAATGAREAAQPSPPKPSARPRTAAPPPAPGTSPAAAASAPAAGAATTTVPPPAAAPAAKPAAPALDLPALEQRLRDTRAIGLFTKLSLKNQVDDLLAEFRGYYDGRAQVTLAELRRSYELLLMKVVTLLQDGDPTLATAVSSSRDTIWAVLSDRKSFTNL